MNKLQNMLELCSYRNVII